MGSDAKMFLRVDDAKAEQTLAALKAARLSTERRGEWLSLTPANAQVAESLSRQLGVAAVYWDIETAVDQVWLRCFVGGKKARELLYSSDSGWAVNRGKPLAFENRAALNQWLAKKSILASPEGYDVLDCFLGLDPTAPVAKTVEPIVDDDANTNFQLAPALVAELAATATRRKLDASQLLQAAWELAKVGLYERETATKEPSQTVELSPPRVPESLALAPKDLPALSLTGYPLACRFRLPSEMASEILAMKQAFGQTGAWMLTEAYLLARGRLAWR